MRTPLWLLLLCSCLVCGLSPARAAGAALAVRLDIEGAIGPATSLYVDHGLREAGRRGARLVILRLDTPGGLDGPMREIIQHLLAAPVPVVAYVAPAGARAASAGTYLLYASHVAAMAPATNLGAATPVPLGGDAPPPAAAPRQDKNPREAASGTAMARKAVNDAAAYLRSLAEQRGRNADWAELAVREGASLSAEAALRLHVIDLIAADEPQLLAQLHGRRLAWGRHTLTLQTAHLVVQSIAPTWRQRVLAVLTNPAVAYVLLLIGIYGLLLEGLTPGALLPGTLGGICLLFALYAFQVLPINYAGLALLALGLALLGAETVVPSAGILGAGGVVAFVAGSLLLLDRDVPGYAVPLGLIATLALLASLLMLLSLGLLWRSLRRPARQAQAGLAGAVGEALEDFGEEGWVEIHGERWRARSTAPVRRGAPVRVVGVQGLVLRVEPRG